MMDTIANKYQFNIIRIFPPWDYYNPKPGEFNFEDLAQLLNICDESGVRVLMTVLLENAPYWLEQAHPETRLVSASGHAVHLGGSGAHYTGGFPGLCFDWDIVRDAAALFVQELVKVSAPHRSLYAYDIWNEPEHVDFGYQEDVGMQIPISEKLFCYCDRTIAEFQNWLQRRYRSLDRLNEAWIRKYPDWKAIDPPRNLVQMYADWMDWLHFIQERMTENMKFRAKTVRDIDSSHVIETHVAYFPPVGPVALSGGQNWRLAEVVDVFGCSFYASYGGTSIDQAAANLEIVRSCTVNKAFWITEMAGNHGNIGYWRNSPVPPRAIRVWNWLGVAAGAKAIIYWTYLTEGTGVEASGFGLVERSGEPTERVEEAAKTNRLIQARWDVLKNYHPQPQIAILFDQDNALLTFAGNGKEDPSIQSAAGYYKAFWNLDFWVDFIEPTKINSSQYKMLVVPWHLIGKRMTCESLRTFVEQGGTVVLETAFSRFDDNYYFNQVIPGNGLDEFFGYREMDSLIIENGRLQRGSLAAVPSGENPYDAEIKFSEPAPVKVKAHTYLTPIEIRSATPIATCRQWTVAARNKIGQGNVYYVGTNLGGSISGGDPGGIDLLRAIASTIVRPEVTSSGALRPRLIRGSQRGLLTVFNYSDADLTGRITVPVVYKHATDIYNGHQHTIRDGKLDMTVPFEDVAVFDLD